MDDDQGKPRRGEIKKKNLLTRQRKGSVKALFLFFGGRVSQLTSDAEQICECGVRFEAVGRLHPLLTAAATQIHGAQRLGSNKKSWMLRLQ